MENQVTEEQNEMWGRWEKNHRRGKIAGGFLIVAIGALFLMREVGVELPYWIFSWKMLLIGIGIVSAIKHKFKHPAWIILITIGSVFLLNDFYPEMHIKPFIWPVLIMLAGLIIIFKPRRNPRTWRRWQRHHWNKHSHGYYDKCYPGDEASESSEDRLECTTIFGSVKKNIISKDFKGGEVTNVFGGTELNLSQADIIEKATLEVTNVFGGTRLIIPSHWEIKSDLVSVIGGIEDKRPSQPNATGTSGKILILHGVVCMGGIEIKSYT